MLKVEKEMKLFKLKGNAVTRTKKNEYEPVKRQEILKTIKAECFNTSLC